jgi:hypothetical protein
MNSTETTTGKWTKKDVRTLCGFIHSFYVVNRPLDHRDNDKVLPMIRETLVKNRKEVVLAGIRGARATCSERYRQYCETVGNQLARFTEYGKPDDLIASFTEMAKEEDKAEKKLESLLHRVLVEDLPEDVVSYDPIAGLP